VATENESVPPADDGLADATTAAADEVALTSTAADTPADMTESEKRPDTQ
jgi:hypothetical protein